MKAKLTLIIAVLCAASVLEAKTNPAPPQVTVIIDYAPRWVWLRTCIWRIYVLR